MGAEIGKIMWEWAPERVTALVRVCIEPGELEDGQGSGDPQARKKQVRAHRVSVSWSSGRLRT